MSSTMRRFRIGTAFGVALSRCQARVTGQLLNITQAPAALNASLGVCLPNPAMSWSRTVKKLIL
jgi:hypothetical protein